MFVNFQATPAMVRIAESVCAKWNGATSWIKQVESSSSRKDLQITSHLAGIEVEHLQDSDNWNAHNRGITSGVTAADIAFFPTTADIGDCHDLLAQVVGLQQVHVHQRRWWPHHKVFLGSVQQVPEKNGRPELLRSVHISKVLMLFLAPQ